jgi:tripeptide aminopeptidase
MATTSAHPQPPPVERLARSPAVARAVEWLERNAAWVTAEQVRITEIPAPTFHEAERAAYLKEFFLGLGLETEIDAVGNVIATRPGREGSADDVVLVSAHIDTVFPPGTEITVRREGSRIYAPGISDNGTGVASLMALARAVEEAGLRTRRTVIFAANVAEEGEGNLLGMRQLVQTLRPRLAAVLVVDGSSTDHVTTRALASRRLEVVVTGPGGHSWSDFGMPNPIHALSRALARFAATRVPEDPRTSFNVGLVSGGTSVNSVPDRATAKVDIRSVSEREMDRLEAALREAVRAGVEEESAAARIRRGSLHWELRQLGARPGGELAADSELMAAVRAVDRYLGQTSRLERSSTDANVPLSLGIPAVTMGGGGQGGAAHSLGEWYNPTGREYGLKRLLLMLAAVAGAEE